MSNVSENSQTMDHLKLAKLFPSNDPLDSPDFDIVDWVNKKFPKEDALDNVDAEIDHMKEKITKVDEEIIFAVSQQSRIGTKGDEELKKAKESIRMLFSKIKEIRDKAIESEQMVQEICKDIRDLDCAKQNLTTTITALTRLHSIVTQTQQLKLMTEKKQYKEVENLLSSVNRMLSLFEDYKHVTKLVQLQAEADAIKKLLKEQIFTEFGELDVSKLGSAESCKNLSHACLVVDALGPGHRKDFIVQFCERQLAVYEKEFAPTSQDYKLESVERRYVWCWQLYQHYSTNYAAVYPTLWNVPEHLVIAFCKKTREVLNKLFTDAQRKVKDDKKKENPGIDFIVYKRALKSTLHFENELSNHFPNADNIDKEEYNAEAGLEIIIPTLHSASQPTATVFKGLISGVFDDHIYVFINHLDKTMSQTFDELIKEEQWKLDNEHIGNKKVNVLQSSCDLVFYFSDTRKNIIAMAKGRPLFETYLLFKKYLKKYAAKLKEKLESLEVKSSKAFSSEQCQLVCLILNTADYCASTTREIEKNISQDILPQFKTEVVLLDVAASFDEIAVAQCVPMVIRNCISVALSSDRPMPNLSTISATNWSQWESIGDQSEYITVITNELTEMMTLFRTLIVPQHFVFLCDSVVDAVTQLFQTQVNQIRGLSEVGAEQLLLDAVILKTFLAKLPAAGLDAADPNRVVSDRFQKRVEKKMAVVENSLRLVMTPKERIVETYKQLYNPANVLQFLKILDLKGIPKSEQEMYLDQYGIKADDRIRQTLKAQGEGILGEGLFNFFPTTSKKM